jgi:hypothetical protein
MAVYAHKKPGESNERLINRFKQVVQRSRIIIKAKQDRLIPTKSKTFARNAAVIRAKHRADRAREKNYG